jgi:hypothetical protein
LERSGDAPAAPLGRVGGCGARKPVDDVVVADQDVLERSAAGVKRLVKDFDEEHEDGLDPVKRDGVPDGDDRRVQNVHVHVDRPALKVPHNLGNLQPKRRLLERGFRVAIKPDEELVDDEEQQEDAKVLDELRGQRGPKAHIVEHALKAFANLAEPRFLLARGLVDGDVEGTLAKLLRFAVFGVAVAIVGHGARARRARGAGFFPQLPMGSQWDLALGKINLEAVDESTKGPPKRRLRLGCF